MRTCRSGLPPATQAAVACVSAAEQPVRDQAPLRAGQLGEARADRLGQLVEVHVAAATAASIAARTSGSIVDPLMIVNVPRALISGRTPMAP